MTNPIGFGKTLKEPLTFRMYYDATGPIVVWSMQVELNGRLYDVQPTRRERNAFSSALYEFLGDVYYEQ